MPWTEQPVYATHATGTGEKIKYNTYSAEAVDMTYYREMGGQLWQMLPDIVVAHVNEPTKIRVSFDIRGVYGQNTVTIQPADIPETSNMHIDGQLLGIYPNDRTQAAFTGYRGIMQNIQEVI